MENEVQEVPRELLAIREENAPALAQLVELKVTDKGSMETAAGGLSTIRGLLKKVDKVRLFLVKPIKDHAGRIDAEARKVKQPLKDAEAHLASEMSHYRAELERIRRDEEERQRKLADRRREKAEAAGKPAPVPEELKPTIAPPAKTVVTEAGTVSFQRIRKWELEDIAAVPIIYLQVNKADITRAVKAGAAEIPGLRIWVEEVPVAR